MVEKAEKRQWLVALQNNQGREVCSWTGPGDPAFIQGILNFGLVDAAMIVVEGDTVAWGKFAEDEGELWLCRWPADDKTMVPHRTRVTPEVIE